MTTPTDGQPQTVRIAIEVVAGTIPGQPDPEHTRRFTITERDWANLANGPTVNAQTEALAQLNGRAAGYAALLQLQPSRLNWVRTDWIWF